MTLASSTSLLKLTGAIFQLCVDLGSGQCEFSFSKLKTELSFSLKGETPKAKISYRENSHSFFKKWLMHLEFFFIREMTD